MVKLPFKLDLKKFGPKSKADTFFTIDIGSDSVKCLAFKLDLESENGLTLTGGAKELLEQHIVRAGNIAEIEKVAQSLDEALFKATEGLEETTKDAIFGIGGDLCTCLITTGKVSRGTTDKVTRKEEEEITQRIVDSAFTRAQNKIAKITGNMDPDIQLITSSTVFTKLDGNLVKQLEGKTGQKIEVALFTAFAPTYHLDMIQEIASTLKLDILAATSNMYALTQSLKLSKENDLLDGVIIDVGSDVTEVSVIFGGGVVDSRTLNIGGIHFTNKLSDSTGLNFVEAERKKHDYSFGNLENSEFVKVENILNGVVGTWLSGIELLFSEFDGVKTFPTDVYLTGGGSKLPLILEALENKPWTKSIPFKEPPQFIKVTTNDVTFVNDVTGNIDQIESVVPMALSSIYLEMQET